MVIGNHKKTSGFTLIELTIALVVIGLITGVILVGQSLIATARIDSLIHDLGHYEAAISNFRGSYKKYPGDSSNFVPPGRGNGDIGLGGASGVTNCSFTHPALSNLEMYSVWTHLSQAGMLKEKYPPYSPKSCTGGIHDSDYNKAVLEVDLAPMVALDSKAAAYVGGYTPYPLEGYMQPQGNFSIFFMFSAMDTLALESKMSARSHLNEKDKGLVNSNGLGQCYKTASVFVSCLDPDAKAALLLYYIRR